METYCMFLNQDFRDMSIWLNISMDVRKTNAFVRLTKNCVNLTKRI